MHKRIWLTSQVNHSQVDHSWVDFGQADRSRSQDSKFSELSPILVSGRFGWIGMDLIWITILVSKHCTAGWSVNLEKKNSSNKCRTTSAITSNNTNNHQKSQQIFERKEAIERGRPTLPWSLDLWPTGPDKHHLNTVNIILVFVFFLEFDKWSIK